ncbi:hypothetical protein HA050_16095 [Iodobacter sp. HSC-16F04]|uniref:Uncharacterized protein n=1 Tax=Iodobacter violaceini TaxID=3044271 RepID=A0ABX0KSK0_9NEIS|nr:hypothetical protein [Iodobacter violacea]NHQ87638.1 hypothetical protein [Iodobacter violacea]
MTLKNKQGHAATALSNALDYSPISPLMPTGMLIFSPKRNCESKVNST